MAETRVRHTAIGRQQKTSREAGTDKVNLGRKDSLFSFYDIKGQIAPERVANAFHMSKSQLAETIGITREALYRQDRVRAPKTQTRVREMIEIVERVKDWAGGNDQAIAWYRSQAIPSCQRRESGGRARLS
jgi:hypothetical protein